MGIFKIFGGNKGVNDASGKQVRPLIADGEHGSQPVFQTKDELVASVLTMKEAAPISKTGKVFDIANTRISTEIEVAAPKNIDDHSKPITTKDMQHLIDKGYIFTIGGRIVQTEGGTKEIEGGKVENNAAEVLKIAKERPESIIATDPNTKEHHGFNDNPANPAMNSAYVYSYIKFKTFMEDKVRPAMDQLGWIAEDTVDCQADAGVDEAIRYIEVKPGDGKIMTLATGGREDIRKALNFLKDIGCTIHPACALQYHVDLSKMSKEEAMETQKNLLKMELENENILYRVAQNGEPKHRGVDTGFLFCKSLANEPITAILHAKDPEQMKNIWYNAIFPGGDFDPNPKMHTTGPHHKSRYHGLNEHSYWYRGSVEFRYFNTTLDPEVAMPHLDMCLGMVKSAYEGTDDWQGIHPLGFSSDSNSSFEVANGEPVSKDQMNKFLNNTVGNSPSRSKLVEFFVTGGGKLIDKPAIEPEKVKASELMSKGYKFNLHVPALSDLDKPILDSLNATEDVEHNLTMPPVDIVEAVDGVKHLQYELEVTTPDGKGSKLLRNSDELRQYLFSK